MKKNKSQKKVSTVLAERAIQVQRGGARAAILGVNDGLVSTLCLVIGVAAAGADKGVVLTAGFAGLVAGAISMAAGEWISVQTQVELFEGVLKDIRSELKRNRDELMGSLAHSLTKYGITKKDAQNAVEDVSSDNADLVNLYASQVIGINPDELGSPWRAAIASFALFSGGSLIPLAAWLIGLHGMSAIVVAIALTALAGLFVGGYTAQSSGKSIVYGSLRQLLIIIFSSIVTYGIGTVIGGNLG